MSHIYSFTPEGRKGEQQVIDYINVNFAQKLH